MHQGRQKGAGGLRGTLPFLTLQTPASGSLSLSPRQMPSPMLVPGRQRSEKELREKRRKAQGGREAPKKAQLTGEQDSRLRRTRRRLPCRRRESPRGGEAWGECAKQAAVRVLVSRVHASSCPASPLGCREDAGGKPHQGKTAGLGDLWHPHSVRAPSTWQLHRDPPYWGAWPREAGSGRGTWTKGSGAESSRAEPQATHAAGGGIWPGDNTPCHPSSPWVCK